MSTKKTLTIVNSANVYAQNYLKSIRPNTYKNIILGDIYNNRHSFLTTVNTIREQSPNTNVSHININSSLLLNESLKDSDSVVYFSHDYLTRVQCKNEQLIQTAKLAKQNNIEKLTAFTPLEFANFNNDSIVESPVDDLNNANDEAIKAFDKTVIIKSDIAFGSSTYFVKYLMQSWAQNYSYASNDNLKHYKFNPIHHSDLTHLIRSVVEDNTSDFYSKKFTTSGKESLSFTDIDNLIKQAFHEGSVINSPNNFLKSLNESFQMMYHGNTHVINYYKMLNHLQGKDSNNDNHEDLTTKFDMKLQSFREYYSKKSENVDGTHGNSTEPVEGHNQSVDKLLNSHEKDNMFYPDYKSYWNVSLN